MTGVSTTGGVTAAGGTMTGGVSMGGTMTGVSTVMVTNLVTVPLMLVAVKVYVVVVIGETEIFREIVLRTEPIELSILNVVAIPPDKVQAKVVEAPLVMVV